MDTTIERTLALLELLAQLSEEGGSHAHECGDCGYKWRHGNENAGSEKAHICPNCAAGPWFGRIPGSEQC